MATNTLPLDTHSTIAAEQQLIRKEPNTIDFVQPELPDLP